VPNAAPSDAKSPCAGENGNGSVLISGSHVRTNRGVCGGIQAGVFVSEYNIDGRVHRFNRE